MKTYTDRPEAPLAKTAWDYFQKKFGDQLKEIACVKNADGWQWVATVSQPLAAFGNYGGNLMPSVQCEEIRRIRWGLA